MCCLNFVFGTNCEYHHGVKIMPGVGNSPKKLRLPCSGELGTAEVRHQNIVPGYGNISKNVLEIHWGAGNHHQNTPPLSNNVIILL